MNAIGAVQFVIVETENKDSIHHHFEVRVDGEKPRKFRFGQEAEALFNRLVDEGPQKAREDAFTTRQDTLLGRGGNDR